jgi:hypothetical protein
LTSEPELYGRPLEFQLSAQGDGQITVAGSVDLRGDAPVCRLAFDSDWPRATELTLLDTGDLKLRLAAQRTVCAARMTLDGEQIDCEVHLRQSPARLDLHGPAVGISQGAIAPVNWLGHVLSGINEVAVTLHVSGMEHDPHWELESNLGPQIAQGLRATLATELQARQNELAAQADAIAQEQFAEFRGLLDQRFAGLFSELNRFEQLAAGSIDLQRVMPTAGRLPGILPAASQGQPRSADESAKPWDRLRQAAEDTLRRR